MPDIDYFTDSPPRSPSPPPPAESRILTVINHIQLRGYHCRALLLPWPHSLCSAILEPALLRTLLPDFPFLASFQLGPASMPAAFPTGTISHHDRFFNRSNPDLRPLLHHQASLNLNSNTNTNTNRNYALQRLSNLTQGDIVFMYIDMEGSGRGRDANPSHILRPGPNPLLHVPEERYELRYDDDDDDDDGYTTQSPMGLRLYPRLPSLPIYDNTPEDPEDVIRQMITHHAEERLEITFEEIMQEAQTQTQTQTQGQDWDWLDSQAYPLLVPGVCFRIPIPPDPTTSRHHHNHHRADVMTVQRNRLLRSPGSGLNSEPRGMVLGVAIHETLADARGVVVIVERLRRELWREVVGDLDADADPDGNGDEEAW